MESLQARSPSPVRGRHAKCARRNGRTISDRGALPPARGRRTAGARCTGREISDRGAPSPAWGCLAKCGLCNGTRIFECKARPPARGRRYRGYVGAGWRGASPRPPTRMRELPERNQGSRALGKGNRRASGNEYRPCRSSVLRNARTSRRRGAAGTATCELLCGSNGQTVCRSHLKGVKVFGMTTLLS